MVTRGDKNNSEIIEYEKRKLERKRQLEKLYKVEEHDQLDADFVLDKYYHNYMDGPY